MLLQIDLSSIFGRNDEGPHELIGLLPSPYSVDNIEAVPRSIEPHSAFLGVLRSLARQIARMSCPCVVMAVTLEGGFDHAPASIGAFVQSPFAPPPPAAKTCFPLPMYPVGSTRPTHSTNPPRL